MKNIPRFMHDSKKKALLLTAALLLYLFVSPALAPAKEVVVIKDIEIKPYRDAIEGFKSACGCVVRELELSDAGALEEAVEARPDAVVAVGTEAFRKVKTIKNIPVIYIMVMPSEADASALSADNVSGVSMDIAPETYLTAIAGLFPGAKRIGVLSDPAHTGLFVQEAAAVARGWGIGLVVKTIRDPRQVPVFLDELRDNVDVLWMLPDSTLVNPDTVNYLMLFSFQHDLPVFSFSKRYVSLGAVAALNINPYDMGAQAGEIARRVTHGGKGPIRSYAKHPRLIVNRKVAAKMGVEINNEVAGHAETIE